jgi:hypothetical protein
LHHHATFDANVKATHVYCISSQETDSNHKDTTKDINKIEYITCEAGVEVADKVAEEYFQGELNLILCTLHIVSEG